jgi:hypothetical protein
MTQARFIADATQDVVLVAFLASVAFIVVYSLLASWWHSPIGRALVMMDASLALALVPSALHQLTGITIVASIGFAWYYLVTLTMVAASTIWRTWIIYRAQRPAAAPVTDETARAAPGSG